MKVSRTNAIYHGFHHYTSRERPLIHSLAVLAPNRETPPKKQQGSERKRLIPAQTLQSRIFPAQELTGAAI